MSQREEIEQAIAVLEAQRAVLGDEAVDAAIATLQAKLASPGGPPVPEQRKQITVFFANVVGFPTLVGTMDPEELGSVMGGLWERLDRVVLDHQGTIDKHIDDTMIALFGAPTAREDDPEQAIRAALTVQAEWQAFLEERGDFGTGQDITGLLQLRIGIHTGPVLVGAMGTATEYTAIGDTVNLTSRLAYAAPVGGVLISHDTYRHVRGVFDVQAMGPTRVKGKVEPISVYVVQQVKPRAFRLLSRGVEGIETRMVGREAELEHLQGTLRDVLGERVVRVVTMVGEAGVGKSRLLNEFENWLELMPEQLLYFRGRATRQMSNLPYSLIRDVMAFRFEIKSSDRAAVAREKLEQGITDLVGAAGVEEAHFIGHMIGFDFSESPYLQGITDDARQIHDRAFHYIAQFFTAAAQDYPVVLLLEDIHWADSGSLDLIDHLARVCRDIPLLIICLARPSLYERRPPWGEKLPQHSRLELVALSKQASECLVVEILRKVPEIPTDLRDLIVGRAEGNPFYIEELVKVLIEDGVIVKGEEWWQIRPDQLVAVRVPPTLAGVLQARLDRLSPLERETLQQASVVGRVFWDGAVAYVGEVTGACVQEPIRRLQERELIFERRISTFLDELECIFKHTLLHEVTYESVLKRLRRVYHTRVAMWLVERSGERVGEYAGLIGEHYERAQEEGLAAEWYGRAGKQALDTYAPEAATGYYQKALAFLPEGPELAARRVELYEGLGDGLGAQARFAEAAESYMAMREAAEMADDMVSQVRAWNGLAWVQYQQGDYRAVLESAGQVEEVARMAGADAQVELARALFWQGWTWLELGNTETALALAEQALDLSTRLNAWREMARTLNLFGVIHEMLGRYDQAVQYKEKALALFRKLDDRRRVGTMLNNLGETARTRGDYSTAVAFYQDALATACEIGNRAGEMLCLSNLGGSRVGLGEYRAAETDLRQVVQMAETTGWGVLSETYRFLAEAYLGQGKLEDARAAARQALSLGQEVGVQEFIGAAWRVLGVVLLRLSQSVAMSMEETDLPLQQYDATACFGESLRIFTEMNAEGERARTLQAWAQYELEHGDKAWGKAMRQEAREIFARLGMEPEES